MKKNNAGFTLIEVMIALAIIAISLSAIIKATSQNIKDTLYLQNKMTAHWVAMNIINQVRCGLIKTSALSGQLEEETILLNETWAWQAYSNNTPYNAIKEIHVIVFKQPNHQALANLTSYQYVTTP